MPYLTIDTNAKIKVSAEILEDAVSLVSETLGKPKNYVIVKINTDKDLIAGETIENIGALIEMKSIGFGDKKALLAQKLTDFAVQRFGAEGRYVGIHFLDMPANDVAHNGMLF